MREHFSKICRVIFGLMLLLQPAVAIAATATHHAQPKFADVLPFWLNFGVFCVVLFLVARKGVAKSWAARVDMIETAVTAGERKLRDAALALEAVKKQEQALPQEISQMQTKISQDAELESRRLMTEAKERAEQIRSQASKTAAAEKLAAENSIREELSEFVLQEAEKRLLQRVDEELDARLRAGALAGVPAMVSRLQ
jgi:F-type H+-transporting ATPase subunit b